VAALSAGDWFGGADAEPPQFDLETLYQPGASSASPPPAPTVSTTVPSARKNTLHTHTPSPSITAIMDSFRSPVSPVKETSKPVAAAPAATPSSTIEKELPIRPKSPTKTTTAPPPQAATPPVASPAPTPGSAPTPAVSTPAAPVAPMAPSFAESNFTDQLVKITTLLESQNETLAAQNAQIRELTKEVDTLKERIVDGGTSVVVGNEELEEESRRKDEIIRKLELELEARS